MHNGIMACLQTRKMHERHEMSVREDMKYLKASQRIKSGHQVAMGCGNVPDCGVRGPRLESHRFYHDSHRDLPLYSLGHGLHTLTAAFHPVWDIKVSIGFRAE